MKLYYTYVIKTQNFRTEKSSNLITSALKLEKTRPNGSGKPKNIQQYKITVDWETDN